MDWLDKFLRLGGFKWVSDCSRSFHEKLEHLCCLILLFARLGLELSVIKKRVCNFVLNIYLIQVLLNLLL